MPLEAMKSVHDFEIAGSHNNGQAVDMGTRRTD